MSDPSFLDPSVYDPTAPNAFTVLRLEGIGVTPYSARGISQTLNPIEAASNLRRTVNGNLVDISFEGFRKYKSTITGSDQAPPNFDDVWPGLEVVVDCAARLAYAPDYETPQRPVVPGSEILEGAHVYYRPRLRMKVVTWGIQEDEYQCQIGWTLDLEEV